MTCLPLSLPTEWMVAVRPVGTLVLVIAHDGVTTMRDRFGWEVAQCQSLLPGGEWCRQRHICSYQAPLSPNRTPLPQATMW